MDNEEACRIVEAALFMSSKPLGAPELGKLLGVAAPGYVSQRLDELKARYADSNGAIEIVEEGGKHYMRLKQQYSGYVKDFTSQGEISKHALRTLAYISKNEGVLKSRLCKALGSTIYSDIHELVEKGFVAQKRSGRSTSVSTTPKFKAYFGQQ